MPLVSHPGTKWRYSNATDVLGYLIEVVSGKSLPVFLEDEIFRPLGMEDTAFYVPERKRSRFATCYTVHGGSGGALDVTAGFRKEGGLVPMALDECYHMPPDVPDGGGGLVSTLDDYLIFCSMLLEKGALPKASYPKNGLWLSVQPAPRYGAKAFRKHRLLSRKTVEFMLRNQLQGDLADYGMPVFLNLSWSGIGFGLGFSVVVDSAKTKGVCSEGECGWGGMASTAFWVDPAEKVACVFLTQLVPSSAYPFRRQLRTMVNATLL
jgi:CubicO group peptidase (beta-lactamase class C family)